MRDHGKTDRKFTLLGTSQYRSLMKLHSLVTVSTIIATLIGGAIVETRFQRCFFCLCVWCGIINEQVIGPVVLQQGSLAFLSVNCISFGKCRWRARFKKSGLKLTNVVACI
jgi:hypothetical protein